MVTSTLPSCARITVVEALADAALRSPSLLVEDVGRIADQSEDAGVADRAQLGLGRRGRRAGASSSSFQSPVWKTRPWGVSISSALPSGIEWASGM